jgi:hypothetical protein
MSRPSLLILFFALSLFVHAADGLKLKFKDGTILSGARIYVPAVAHSTGNPDERGVILMYHDKLYIHHFPYRQPRKVIRVIDDGVDDGIYKTAAVMEELEHYRPRSSPLDPSPRELFYSCTPSRIAFFHFDQPSLNVLSRSIARHSRIPRAHQQAALKAIQYAYYANPKPAYYNTPLHSQIWQREADRDVARYQDKVFYGKWIDQPALAPATFQKSLSPRRKRAP